MRISKLAFATGMLSQVPQVDAWFGEDIWDWMFGGDSDDGPIAFRRMNDPENFIGRCTPSSDCWPSEEEWDALEHSLAAGYQERGEPHGELLRNVEPYLKPCYSLYDSDECTARSDNYTNAYYRDDIPGTMMMPMFECEIGEGKCCLDNLNCR